MAILALDLGTKTGWAVRSNGAIASGTQNFTPTRYQSTAMRFVRFRTFLTELHKADPIAHIGFEEVRKHAGVDAAHAYGGFMAHLLAFGEDHTIPVEPFTVGAIKKYWAGKGNASKEDMIAAAVKLGFKPEDDNEADALAILHMMMGGSVL